MRKMNKKGFTLVELMVVLAILGLLAAIGIPQYLKVQNRARIGADRVTITAFQHQIDAFVAETGGSWTAGEKTFSDTVKPSGITAISNLTGTTVKLSDFLDGGDTFPSLKTSTSPTWKISAAGTVEVVISSDLTITGR